MAIGKCEILLRYVIATLAVFPEAESIVGIFLIAVDHLEEKGDESGVGDGEDLIYD